MKKHFTRVFALICSFALCLGMVSTAGAAHIAIRSDVRASDYFDYYKAEATTGAKREVVISYDVIATGTMDQVGVSSITVQEKNGSSWTGIATYWGSVFNGMLVTDTDEHSGSVTYTGTSGKDYRAMVTFYAEDIDGDDSKTVYT